MLINDRCNYGSLEGQALKVLMNDATKEFWDMLFILYLIQNKSSSTAFKIIVMAAEVVESEAFNASNFAIPKYYTHEIKSFTHFFLKSHRHVISTQNF